jgi:hypothetical protein
MAEGANIPGRLRTGGKKKMGGSSGIVVALAEKSRPGK